MVLNRSIDEDLFFIILSGESHQLTDVTNLPITPKIFYLSYNNER